MKAWKLTGVKEYKQFTTDVSNANEDNLFDCPDLDQNNPDIIKVKMIKSNLSVVDIDRYNAICDSSSVSLTPGRSGIAVVSESFDPTYEVGRRVFLSPYRTDSKDILSTRSFDCDGYLSDYAVVESCNAYPIPEGMSDNDTLFVEDVAITVSMLDKLNLSKGEYIALRGASYHNCVLAQLAIYYQAIPIIIDDNEDRLTLAQNLGVYYTINTTIDDAYRKTVEITSGKMFDALVIDTDTFPTIDKEIPLLKRGAIIGIYGYKKCSFDLSTQLVSVLRNALTIIGVDNGYTEIRSAINLIANKVLKFDNLIETETPFNSLLQIVKSISDNLNAYKHIITFS